MAIVTLTSDWSKGDYYLGALKGKLASLSPEINFVEITNSIPSFDVLHETFLLKNSYNHFPPGSIHLLGVMCEPSNASPMVIVYANNHYFVGVNDGRFSHLFENPPSIAFKINSPESFSNFLSLDLFVSGVETVLKNSFEQTTKACDLKKESVTRVVYDESSIVGRVIYIDSFGNAITNIEKTVFDRVHKARNFTIFVQGPYTKINKISRTYSQNNPGELLAIFNSLGFLEIAINMGSLEQTEGITLASEIRIKFNNE